MIKKILFYNLIMYASVQKIIPNDSKEVSPKEVSPNDEYKYERKRLGKNTVSPSYQPYGPYLYRNTRNNILVASFEKPTNKDLYSGYDIGINTDALIYYKN